jgi:hypothetical protein
LGLVCNVVMLECSERNEVIFVRAVIYNDGEPAENLIYARILTSIHHYMETGYVIAYRYRKLDFKWVLGITHADQCT